ncbi:MAG: spore coat protein [Oscillospiraceae bacterium]
MANLTTKELSALEDQLGFEKVMCCKYQDAMQQCTDQQLKSSYQQYAGQHKQNYDTLLNFLK